MNHDRAAWAPSSNRRWSGWTGPEYYVAVGRDIENAVLARAVKWHCEHRILINGRRTVVFS